MTNQDSPQGRKTLIFQLRGGPQGPHLVRSDETQDSLSAAQRLWTMTLKGIVGRRFDWGEPDGSQRRYQVVDKQEDVAKIVITCQCVDDS